MTTQTHSSQPDRPRLTHLDTLRGLAALWVVFFHMIFLAQPNLVIPANLSFLRVGGMGVTLFFMLSAFSLCLTMPRHIETGRWLLSFYVHRACRILPLFYTVLAFTIYFFHTRGVDVGWDRILINITCLFNLIGGAQESIVMAGWAVGVELLFYAVFPLLYRYFNTLPRSILLFVLSLVIAIVARQIIADETFFKWSIFRHAPIFTGGMVIFHLIQKAYRIDLRIRHLLGWALCISAVPAFLHLHALGFIPSMDYYAQLVPFGLILAGLSLTPLPVLVSPATAFLGKISFSVYLLHPLLVIQLLPIYPKIYALNLGNATSLALCASMTLVLLLPLAYISFVYIEQPGMALGKWIVGRYTSLKAQPTPIDSLQTNTNSPFENCLGFLHAHWAKILAFSVAVFASWFAIRYAGQPIIEAHGFRQTQTALTSFWMMKEGWQLAYQTPVAGYPWSIPFEFPIYQSIAALIAKTGGFNLDVVGRLLSFSFLLACAWPAFAIARRLALSNLAPWIFCALLWSSPLYLFWGRTFMIETTALFFTLAAIPHALDLRIPSPRWRSVILFAGWASLGMLQKVTTAAPAFMVMGLFLLGSHINARGLKLPSWRQLASWTIAFVTPFFIGLLWSHYADIVKLQNPFGAALTSKNLMLWNFGTFAQRMDPHVWKMIIWDRVLVNNAAGIVGISLLASTLIWGERRSRGPILLCLTLFVLPLTLFTSLHRIHDYYQASCTAFLLGAMAIACTHVSSQSHFNRSIAPILAAILVTLNLYRFSTGYAASVHQQLDTHSNTTLAVSDVIRRHTPIDSRIVVFGDDWNSETAYYSQRKSFTVPTWFGRYDRAWKNPVDFTEGEKLGAVVYYMPWGSSNVTQIVEKPEIKQIPHLFKVNDAYVWIPGSESIVLPDGGRIALPMEFTNTLYTTLPGNYVNGEPIHAEASIDLLNGNLPSTQTTTVSTQLHVTGWCAVSGKDGVVPDHVFVTLTPSNGIPLYASTQPSARNDVKNYYERPTMPDVGFEAIIDMTTLKGSYVLGLARGYKGKLEQCTQFAIPISIMR